MTTISVNGHEYPLEHHICDVLVVGSGGAGSSAAAVAAAGGARVLMVSKDPMVCSDSKISEGIVTVRGSASTKDTPEALAANLRVQGDDLADEPLVRAFADDSASAYQWLQQQGLRSAEYDPASGQPKALGLPLGGHTMARSVDHPNGGLDYGHALWSAVQQQSLEVWEDAWCIDLLQAADAVGKQVDGALVYLPSQGRLLAVQAKATVLACGGLSTLYFPHTDTMRGNTGDGYAMACRAGAQLVDMEQVQFIPFAIAHPKSYEGLVVGEPISAGLLGVLRDNSGEVILSGLMARTRAECAAAIARAVAEGRGTEHGGCYLDLTANVEGPSGAMFKALMESKIASILRIVKSALGAKAARFEQPWEVKPSAHYLMGGVSTRDDGSVLNAQQQAIQGLFAAGQVLGGLHGSNRLGSTSLAEGVIFGRRAGKAAAAHASGQQHTEAATLMAQAQAQLEPLLAGLGQASSQPVLPLTRQLQQASWEGIGPARTGAGISKVTETVAAIRQQMPQVNLPAWLDWNQPLLDWLELRNLLDCADAVALSAQQRQASVGAHVRLDNDARERDTYSVAVARQGEGLHVSRLPRPATPWLQRVRVLARQQLKIQVMKGLTQLPPRLREPVLFKIYSKALGQPADSGQTMTEAAG